MHFLLADNWFPSEEPLKVDYSPLGVFPYAGFRYRVGGGCLKNSGFNTGIWTQDTYQLSIYIIPYDQRPSIKRDRGYRSDGYSVRCAKDE